MANLTNMLEHVAKLPRSGFDVSQSFAFTASTGMILPVYSEFLNSSERVTISTDFFARTQPLVTAAMADVDVYLDWFFVPMQMLYTPWGQIRWQTNDYLSSAVMELGGDTSPLSPANPGGFPLLDVDSSLDCYNSDASLSFNRPAFFSPLPTNLESPDSALYFSNDSTFGFDSSAKSLFRVADCLGFNPYSVFKGYYETSPSASDPTSPYGEAAWNPNVFPWKALAYQCIYQNWFRNDDFEVRDVKSYNWDWLAKAGSAVSLAGDPRNPFTLRYADYRKDYFTSVKPSPLFSSMNMLFGYTMGGSPSYNQSPAAILSQVDNYLSVADGSPTNSGLGTPTGSLILGEQGLPGSLNSNMTQVTESFDSGSSFSYPYFSQTASLRSLFAVEKLLRITGRAAKTYDAQTLAHFGFKVPHDVKHDITHLHSSHGMLHIGEVVSTADTYSTSGSVNQGSSLGEISGKGYVSIHDDHKTKFTAPVDGALMCVFRAIPRLRVVNAFDKQNSITNRLDLFIPEYDKLGMQPLYNYEVFPFIAADGNISQVGWQLRYQQFKQKYDRVSAAFSATTSAKFSGVINQYSAWVLSYTPFRDALNATVGLSNFNGSYLKCPPTALNTIMAVEYSPTVNVDSFITAPWTAFYTDPFICDFRANVKKVSPMSPTGEPDMISL